MNEMCIENALAQKNGYSHRPDKDDEALVRCFGEERLACCPRHRDASILEFRAMQRAAQELVRAKSEFLCLAAHDLCQPLQSLDLLIDEIGHAAAPSSPDLVDLAQISRLAVQAQASLARMRELVRMLLEIARLESGTVRIDTQPVPVAEMFEYLKRQFTPVARAKALGLKIEPSAYIIDTDPTLLRGMLANFVANAFRYTSTGEVRLQSTAAADGCLRLAVRDTGIGIPASEITRIFEDFHRVGDAEGPGREGFGLGLGLVRRLSALLGLPVKAESIVGRGSTFAVEIPAVKVHRVA